jgi:hypothetical protein
MCFAPDQVETLAQAKKLYRALLDFEPQTGEFHGDGQKFELVGRVSHGANSTREYSKHH